MSHSDLFSLFFVHPPPHICDRKLKVGKYVNFELVFDVSFVGINFFRPIHANLSSPLTFTTNDRKSDVFLIHLIIIFHKNQAEKHCYLGQCRGRLFLKIQISHEPGREAKESEYRNVSKLIDRESKNVHWPGPKIVFFCLGNLAEGF